MSHRAYWERLHGKVPPGHDLDHLCRNRRCVNPDHLEPVTRKQNNRRGARSKLNPSIVAAAKSRYEMGNVTVATLASEIGVDDSTLYRAIVTTAARRTWGS